MTSSDQKIFDIIKKSIQDVKTVDEKNIQLNSYVGQDIGLDSIGVVDLWFEIKKNSKHPFDINDFFEFIKKQNLKNLKNDFKIEVVFDYIKLKMASK